MKSSKRFIFLIVTMVLILFFLDWVRNTYYPLQTVSPVARIRTIFVFATGIIIMKLCTTKAGFKIFLFSYLVLWGVFYVLTFLTAHKIGLKTDDCLVFYRELVPLETPLPLI